MYIQKKKSKFPLLFLLMTAVIVIAAGTFYLYIHRKAAYLNTYSMTTLTNIKRWERAAQRKWFSEPYNKWFYQESILKDKYLALIDTLEQSGEDMSSVNPDNIQLIYDLCIQQYEMYKESDTAQAAQYSFYIGIIHLLNMQEVEAIQSFSRAVALEPRNLEYLFFLATGHDIVNNYNKAIEFYSACMDLPALSPHDKVYLVSAHFSLATVYAEQQQNLYASKLFELTRNVMKQYDLKLPFINASILNNLGYLNTQMGTPQNGIISYREAITLYDKIYLTRPNLPEVNVVINLGRAYEAIGQLPVARSTYKKALNMVAGIFPDEVHPILARISYYIGMTYFKEQDYEQAAPFFNEAIDKTAGLEPQDVADIMVTFHNYLGICYFKMDEYQRAKLHFITAMETAQTIHQAEPTDKFENTIIDLHINLGKTFAKLDDYDGAIRHLLDAINLRKSSGHSLIEPRFATVYGNLGGAYSDLGNYDMSIKAYEECIHISAQMLDNDTSPFQAVIYKNLSAAYRATGNTQKENVYLKKYNDVIERLNSLK